MWKFAFLICSILANFEMVKAPNSLIASSNLVNSAALIGPSNFGGPNPRIAGSGKSNFLTMAKKSEHGDADSQFHNQHSNKKDGLSKHSDGHHPNAPVHQNKPKNGQMNPIKKLAQMPLNALYKILRPIEFVLEVMIMAPIIWASLQKTNDSFTEELKDKEPEREYFIEAIEALMNLANSASQKLEEEVGKILEKHQHENQFNVKKLKKIVVNVLVLLEGGENVQIPPKLNPMEHLLVKSLIKGKKFEEGLKSALGTLANVGKDVGKLATQGAVAMLAIILAPIEFGGRAYIVFSIMHPKHQYEKSANSHYSLKLRILFAMDRFQRWLGEIGNSIKKTEEFKKNIMKIFGGNQIENEFGIGNLEKEFDEILKERMGAKNANDFNSILRTLNDQLEFHNGIKMTELGAAESDVEFDLEDEDTQSESSPLNLNGLSQPNGDNEEENDPNNDLGHGHGHGHGHNHPNPRPKRGIKDKEQKVVGFLVEEEMGENKIRLHFIVSPNPGINIMDLKFEGIE